MAYYDFLRYLILRVEQHEQITDKFIINICNDYFPMLNSYYFCIGHRIYANNFRIEPGACIIIN